MKNIRERLNEAVAGYTQDHGFTIVGLGYLGKNDGTNTCVDTSFASVRRMFYFTASGGVAKPYSSAILFEGSGIIYEDSADNTGKSVKLGYIPGDKRLYILGYAGVESFNASSGKTGTDSRLINGTFPALSSSGNAVGVRTSKTPTGSADSSGTVGDICWDNSFVYVKTGAGWKRAALSTF
jgi:hypothetical protein